jgi:hypothetical protein
LRNANSEISFSQLMPVLVHSLKSYLIISISAISGLALLWQ